MLSARTSSAQLCDTGMGGAYEGASTSRMLTTLRLMRNLCAGDEAISKQMVAHGAHVTASQLVIDHGSPPQAGEQAS